MFVVSNFYLLRSSFIGSMLRLQRPLFQTSLLFQDWTVHRAKYIKKGKVDIYREHHHYLSICEFYLPWLWVHDFRIFRTISYRWRIMCICVEAWTGSCLKGERKEAGVWPVRLRLTRFHPTASRMEACQKSRLDKAARFKRKIGSYRLHHAQLADLNWEHANVTHVTNKCVWHGSTEASKQYVSTMKLMRCLASAETWARKHVVGVPNKGSAGMGPLPQGEFGWTTKVGPCQARGNQDLEKVQIKQHRCVI